MYHASIIICTRYIMNLRCVYLTTVYVFCDFTLDRLHAYRIFHSFAVAMQQDKIFSCFCRYNHAHS